LIQKDRWGYRVMEDVTRETYYSSYKKYILENSFSISLTDQSINAWAWEVKQCQKIMAPMNYHH